LLRRHLVLESIFPTAPGKSYREWQKEPTGFFVVMGPGILPRIGNWLGQQIGLIPRVGNCSSIAIMRGARCLPNGEPVSSAKSVKTFWKIPVECDELRMEIASGDHLTVVEYVTVKAPKSHKVQQGLAASL